MYLYEYYNQYNINNFEGHCQQNIDEINFLCDLVKNENIIEVMEIGFNGGHSAELFLLSNNKINLVSFDIGTHEYIQIGKEFIDKTYPNRHNLIIGDSNATIPNYNEKQFDIIFIDGGHDYDTVKNDLTNCKKLSHKNTLIVLDDTMNKKEWINSWNKGPNKCWKEAKKNKEAGKTKEAPRVKETESEKATKEAKQANETKQKG